MKKKATNWVIANEVITIYIGHNVEVGFLPAKNL
jgi:hypothetical protein